MNISRETFANIESALLDLDAIESARLDYSGRGMYGRQCIGFVTDNPFYLAYALTTVIRDLEGDCTYEDLPEMDYLANSARTDSMAMSTIVYWPRWGIEEN